MLQKVFFGAVHCEDIIAKDIKRRSLAVFLAAALLLLAMGLFPQAVLNQSSPWIAAITAKSVAAEPATARAP